MKVRALASIHGLVAGEVYDLIESETPITRAEVRAADGRRFFVSGSVLDIVPEERAPLYDLRNGELCGAGCSKPFSYVATRVRKYCKAEYAVVTAAEKRVLDRLLSEYPAGRFWASRNGTLVEAVCRDAAAYVRNLDNWTEAELDAAATEGKAAGLLS